MRADKFFAEKFGSRTKAADALKRGWIIRNGKVLSPDDEVRDTDVFQFINTVGKFVSNGGYKLERGMDCFQESVFGNVFVDLGSSTGGFCDCLLQRGAKRVYCIDVGEKQLDAKIANDPRVIVRDHTNARYLTKSDFSDEIDGATSDLSFISIQLVLPVIFDLLKENGRAFLLFKPQFECGGKGIGKSGIVSPSKHSALLEQFYISALKYGLAPQNIVNAPIREKKNIEYIVFLRKNATPISQTDFLNRAKKMYEDK